MTKPMTEMDVNAFDWDKGDGLLPAVIQDSENLRILMLGYMNKEALAQTIETKRATFFSRSKQRIWTKGETSGNFLDLVSLEIDCDKDTILVQAKPRGPACHLNKETCFNDESGDAVLFLKTLSEIIKQRNQDRPDDSYTTKLFKDGKSRIAQKVGEESVELVLACMKEDKQEILSEAADLVFHIMVLLENAELNISEVCDVLSVRHLDKLHPTLV